ncbi:MAG TPA: DUF5069 domain-containing protein [Candidatus Acidoferrum sp.]|nr:DUF5069 domain-containing protein [Candidatus Acidoferrum sp.]
MKIQAMDLTKRPPRSARVRLGGYAILPRSLDKGRADVAGTVGEFIYACPLDQQFLEFAGIDPAALREQLAADKGDGEILQWIQSNAKHRRTDAEIAAWSCYQDHRPPSAIEVREFFHGMHKEIAPHRTDIATWFDLLDVDDYVSYGGKP